MDEFVAEFAGSEGFLPLVAAGVIFVLVNTLSHAVQHLYSERRSHKQLVNKALTPLLNATSDLISRIGEILVFQRPTMLEALRAHRESTLSELAVDSQVNSLKPESLDRVQSTAYRLLRFLVFVHNFHRVTADVPAFSRLRHANYFLQRKIPTSLKGGLYRISMLSKEIQENMAAELLDAGDLKSAADFNVGHFCRLIREGKIDQEMFRQAMTVFSLDPEPIKNQQEIDHHSTNWCKILGLAHVGVYLIDFFQDLSNSPRWEEYRVFFVALIRHWNTKTVTPRYLYEVGDVNSQANNYIDTFSERLAWKHPLYRLERLLPKTKKLGSIRHRYRRLIKYRVLLARGARYVGPHHHKDVERWGLRIHGRTVHDLRWTDPLGSLHVNVCNYLRSEGMVGEHF